VDEFGDVGRVDDIDGDGFALAHAENGAGGGAVVADGREDALGGELDGDRGDAEGVVGFACGWRSGVLHRPWRWRGRLGGQESGCCCLGEGEAAEPEEVAPLQEEGSPDGWTHALGVR
jgi:hypothetical protein